MVRKKHVTRSVRIDRDLDDRLREVADERGLSVNYIASLALRQFAEWDAYGDKFGLESLPGSCVAKLFDYLPEEKVRELAQWVGSDLLRQFTLFWFRDTSLETILQAYPRLMGDYGNFFEYEERNDEGQVVVILKHGLGNHWSLFHGEVIRTAFDRLLRKPVKVEETVNQVTVRFSAY